MQPIDVVVVGDNPTLLTLLSEIFKEQNYTVRTVADGFAALAVIKGPDDSGERRQMNSLPVQQATKFSIPKGEAL